MKCPYRKRTVHQPDRYKDGTRYFAVDIEEYAECHEKECPFYREGTCMKADSDMRGDRMKDLIERQTAIDALDCINGAEEVLRSLPPAQRKKGKWDTHDVVKILASGKVLDGFMQCTVCGCVFDDHSTEYHFCPNCGADMRGEQDE